MSVSSRKSVDKNGHLRVSAVYFVPVDDKFRESEMKGFILVIRFCLCYRVTELLNNIALHKAQ